jgi:hypothetical protein
MGGGTRGGARIGCCSTGSDARFTAGTGRARVRSDAGAPASAAPVGEVGPRPQPLSTASTHPVTHRREFIAAPLRPPPLSGPDNLLTRNCCAASRFFLTGTAVCGAGLRRAHGRHVQAHPGADPRGRAHPRGRPRQGPLGPQQLHGLPHAARRGRLLRPRAHAGVPPRRPRLHPRDAARPRGDVPGPAPHAELPLQPRSRSTTSSPSSSGSTGWTSTASPRPRRSTRWRSRQAAPSRAATTGRRCSTSSAWRATRSAGRAGSGPGSRHRRRALRRRVPRALAAATPTRQARAPACRACP